MKSEVSESDIAEKIKSLTIELESLKQENKKLAVQLRQSKIQTVGEWSIDLRTSQVYWSKGMYELLNVKKDIAPDMKIFYKKLSPENSDRLKGAIQSVFLTKKNFSFEHEIISDESGTLNVRTDLSILLDEDSRPLRILP